MSYLELFLGVGDLLLRLLDGLIVVLGGVHQVVPVHTELHMRIGSQEGHYQQDG